MRYDILYNPSFTAESSVGVDVMLFYTASPSGDGHVIQLHLRMMDRYYLWVTMIPLVEYLTNEIYEFAFGRYFYF